MAKRRKRKQRDDLTKAHSRERTIWRHKEGVEGPALFSPAVLKLLNKYGRLCWLCKKELDLSVAPNHPMAPTKDHVIERYNGLDNLSVREKMDNIRLAHGKCNWNRKNIFPHTDTEYKDKIWLWFLKQKLVTS